jgi:hypothetical protein
MLFPFIVSNKNQGRYYKRILDLIRVATNLLIYTLINLGFSTIEVT